MDKDGERQKRVNRANSWPCSTHDTLLMYSQPVGPMGPPIFSSLSQALVTRGPFLVENWPVWQGTQLQLIGLESTAV